MPNTYSQIYIQFVFAVKHRVSLINPSWESDLHRYITGCVQRNNHKLIAINGMEDHLHVFVGLNTIQSLSGLMQIVKGESSEWVNKQKMLTTKFEWQQGYGAFSYGKSQIDDVCKYILNQKKHHARASFLDEYMAMLDKFEVKYDNKYIFRPPE